MQSTLIISKFQSFKEDVSFIEELSKLKSAKISNNIRINYDISIFNLFKIPIH